MATDRQIEAATLAMMRCVGTNPDNAPAKERTRLLARAAIEAVEALERRNVLAHRTAGRRIDNAKRAFERRFGKSLMPLTATRFTREDGRECVKILDPATGTWCEYTICSRRVHRLREYDNNAT